MNFSRGDVAITRFPHAGGTRGKKRPVVVVQADPQMQSAWLRSKWILTEKPEQAK